MEAEVIKTFRFEAAHSLPNAPDGHKCRHMHGHKYRVDVHFAGAVDPHRGWVIDFGEIASVVGPVVMELDHHLLNELPGLDNPTSELMARYLFDRIASLLPGVSAVTVWESDTSCVIYRGGQVCFP